MPAAKKPRRSSKTPTIPESEETRDSEPSSDSSTPAVASSSGIPHSQQRKSPTLPKPTSTTLSVKASPFTPGSNPNTADKNFTILSRVLDEELTNSEKEAAARALDRELDNISNDNIQEVPSPVPEKPPTPIHVKSHAAAPRKSPKKISTEIIQKVLTGKVLTGSSPNPISQSSSQLLLDPELYRNGKREKSVKSKSKQKSKQSQQNRSQSQIKEKKGYENCPEA